MPNRRTGRGMCGRARGVAWRGVHVCIAVGTVANTVVNTVADLILGTAVGMMGVTAVGIDGGYGGGGRMVFGV